MLWRTYPALSASRTNLFSIYNNPHCFFFGLIAADKPDVCIHTQFNSINTCSLCSSVHREIALKNTLDKAWNLVSCLHFFILSPTQLSVVSAYLLAFNTNEVKSTGRTERWNRSSSQLNSEILNSV